MFVRMELSSIPRISEYKERHKLHITKATSHSHNLLSNQSNDSSEAAIISRGDREGVISGVPIGTVGDLFILSGRLGAERTRNTEDGD